jgi:hypothetical protein
MKKPLIFLAAFLVLVWGCNIKIGLDAPPLDWENFDPAHIDNTLSEKGALGSYRVIFWQSSPDSYTRARIVYYATSKGWTFTGEAQQDSSEMLFYHQAYRAIVDTVFKSQPKNKPAPAWFNTTCIIYQFKYLHREQDRRKNKIYHSEVMVSSDGSKMCVYPLLDDS